MLSAAFSLAFFGLLRVSEFTVPSQRAFNHQLHPTQDSIKWGRGQFTFHIKRSKTDQLQHGEYIHIRQSGGELCPVRAMRKYLEIRDNRQHAKDPLFIFSNHSPLTRRSCLKNMRHLLRSAGYEPELFNTHSFRIGAATHAAQLGMPSHHITALGRWHSSAYQRYTRASTTTRKRAASQLATSFVKYS